MNDRSESLRIKSALFVDFDNVYLGLKATNPAAAERFAQEPAKWLRWIEEGLPADRGTDSRAMGRRDVLIRRCYLNPKAFGEFRNNFTRSAFSVVDCPPITFRGKTSADIHMVMDILDTLGHKTHFDEFIILSGDSDFAPVVLRLRAHDRRSIIFAMGPAAEAYRNSCDRVVTKEELIRNALGTEPRLSAAEPVTIAAASDGIIQEIAAVVRRVVSNSQRPVAMGKAGAEVDKALGGRMARSGWRGMGFKKLLEKALQSMDEPGFAVAARPHAGYVYDPSRHPLPFPIPPDGTLSPDNNALLEKWARGEEGPDATAASTRPAGKPGETGRTTRAAKPRTTRRPSRTAHRKRTARNN